MKVRIESDGTPVGTRVFNADTGEEVLHVTRLLVDITPLRFKGHITTLEMGDGKNPIARTVQIETLQADMYVESGQIN